MSSPSPSYIAVKSLESTFSVMNTLPCNEYTGLSFYRELSIWYELFSIKSQIMKMGFDIDTIESYYLLTRTMSYEYSYYEPICMDNKNQVNHFRY